MSSLPQFVFLPVPVSVCQGAQVLPVSVLENVHAIIDKAIVSRPQGYRMSIDKDGVAIVAADEAGKYYAQCTLNQIRSQAKRFGNTADFDIDDYPAIPVRGVALDMSRDRIPSMPELKKWIDRFAQWKMNIVKLYIEHTYAYKGCEDVWQDATPFTESEILELKAYCAERHIMLMPEQQSFGHLHRWLRVEPYRQLAECPQGWKCSWSMDATDPFSLCPVDPKSLEFIDRLWSEIIPVFGTHWLGIGCDETADLGLGRSKEECEKIGMPRVYLNFIKKLAELSEKHNVKAHIFADIFFLHPELIPEVPRNLVINDWGYRPDYDFDSHAKQFHELGFDFTLQGSNSNYTCFNGRSYRWRENGERLVDAAVKYGALAVFSSEWGDNGHWNEPITAIPGDAYFAAISWAPDANRNADLATALDEFVFQPGSGAGQLLLDCGKPYIHMTEPNGSDILWLFMLDERFGLGKIEEVNVTPEKLYRIRTDLIELMPRLKRATGFIQRDRQALDSHARWMLLVADVAAECLEHAVPSGKFLPLESRQQYAKRFDDIRIELIRLRDDGTSRLGGRTEALDWLQYFRDNLCGTDV